MSTGHENSTTKSHIQCLPRDIQRMGSIAASWLAFAHPSEVKAARTQRPSRPIVSCLYKGCCCRGSGEGGESPSLHLLRPFQIKRSDTYHYLAPAFVPERSKNRFIPVRFQKRTKLLFLRVSAMFDYNYSETSEEGVLRMKITDVASTVAHPGPRQPCTTPCLYGQIQPFRPMPAGVSHVEPKGAYSHLLYTYRHDRHLLLVAFCK